MNKKNKELDIIAKRLNVENKELSKQVFDDAEKATLINPSNRVFIQMNTNDKRGSVFLGEDLRMSSKVAAFTIPEENITIEKGYNSLNENIEIATANELVSIINNGYEGRIVGKTGINIIISITESHEKKVKKDKAQYEQLELNLVNNNVLTEDELKERKQVLKANGIEESNPIYTEILSLIRKQNINVVKPKKVYVMSSERKEEESVLKRVLRNITLGDPVILEGAKGTGKNVCWETVAWLLNRPMEVLNCSAKMTKADMFGSPTTDNTAKEKVTLKGAKALFKALLMKKDDADAAEFLYATAGCMSPAIKLEQGPVTRALLSAEEKGTILIADELNLSDPNTFSGVFNALTDKHTKEYNINGIGVVPIPDDLIIGGTQNGTGGAYIGTKQQNDATMSRFNIIRINAPESIMPVLNNNNYDVSYDVLKTLDRIYISFAKAKKQGTVSEQALNVRGFERTVQHIMSGQSIIEAVKECVIYSCKASEEGLLITTALDQIKED